MLLDGKRGAWSNLIDDTSHDLLFLGRILTASLALPPGLSSAYEVKTGVETGNNHSHVFGTVLSTKLKNVVSLLIGCQVGTGGRPSEGSVVDGVEDLWDLCPNTPRQLLFQDSFAFGTIALCALGDRVERRFLQAQ
jgi:hypothetical protein